MRFISATYAVLILLFVLLVYYEMPGFPDGHKTEFDRAMHVPLTIFNWITIIFSIFFVYISIRSVTKVKQKFAIAFLLHLFLCFLLYCIRYYYKYYLNLNYGQGA